MASPAELSWAKIDEKIRAGRTAVSSTQTGSVVPLNGALASGKPIEAFDPGKKLLADWTSVLDTINEAGALAQEREKRLAAQAAAHQQALADLRAQAQQCREESHANGVRAQALIVQAEQRARLAEERAREAEARASHAEAWLQRIGEAVDILFAGEEPVALARR